MSKAKIKPTLSDAQKIQRVAKRHAQDGWTFRARYTGKYMSGRECPGIVCSAGDTIRVADEVRRAGIRRQDNADRMGDDMIVYWPYVAFDPATTREEG